ncbi:hypothetical protein AN639_08440 [Candidatus Epulonipiscium fishelsonii]|uniref:Uncharacterized protein n=1 Tax=Candidatus Epulonipiscium fishelsonii TaxID=77094 RepID=A0ACC8XG81_9FIRM|nr:hypothetical protein AN639_08440 [Epulopiscium sp. SCG-B05WGA-EpuloA1]ONI42486.1 hypothetical protein AN396_14225 [Epulopiscium sp. SCG-B11WGA-EpuloA1]
MISYQALNAKIQGRKHILFQAEDWNKIVKFTTPAEIFDYFKNKYGYMEYLPQDKKMDLHRGDFEVSFHRLIVGEIEKMLHYMSCDYKVFFKTMLMKYEIHDLELILRDIESINKPSYEIDKHFIHSEKYESINFKKLIEVKDFKQFIEQLNNTPYHEPLKTLEKEDIKDRYWHMEMKASTTFYKLFTERAKKLSEVDAEIASRIIGTKIDCLNIEWIYRAKKYYNISKEEMLIYSLPNGYKISFGKLKKLIYVEDIKEFKKLAESYISSPIFVEDDELLEKHLNKLFYEMLNKQENQDGVGKLLGYIYKSEIELKDLVSIIEGLRYGLNQQQITQYLVNKRVEAAYGNRKNDNV